MHERLRRAADPRDPGSVLLVAREIRLLLARIEPPVPRVNDAEKPAGDLDDCGGA
jgi:hypothetical protein